MTKTGYSLKRPTLKANYIRILQTVKTLDALNVNATSPELQKITGITHDMGFNKALNKLVEAGALEIDPKTKKISYDLIDGGQLIADATVSSARNIDGFRF